MLLCTLRGGGGWQAPLRLRVASCSTSFHDKLTKHHCFTSLGGLIPKGDIRIVSQYGTHTSTIPGGPGTEKRSEG
jgi:hypothetical protein